MKKQFLFLFLLLMASTSLQSQVQLVSGAFTSAGGDETSEVSLDFALGQTFSVPYEGAVGGSEGVLQVVKLISTNTKTHSLENVSVFPNPTSHMLHVNANCSESYNLKVYDSSGRLVMSVLDFSCEKEVDFSQFQTGTYIVQISNHEAQSVFRINKL